MQLHFENREKWRRWLRKNHDAHKIVWLVFFKKHTGRKNITYAAAVEEALCFGWIDSLIKKLDEDRYARKFTPRTDTGKWSALNLKRVKRLIASGRMTKIGLAKVPSDVQPQPSASGRPVDPPLFLVKALKQHPAAWRFFNTLAPSYRRNYIGWVSSAKREETRKKRLDEAISLLSEGKKLGMK
jgi:uncharacterized protein YdeI (YjbR/CyaY-like superfamily)